VNQFYSNIFEVVCLIPKGRVSTYGAIASFLAAPQASRNVGWALSKCRAYKEYVPAHRVVNRIGLLSAKHQFPTEQAMQELLEAEGIRIENDLVLNFESVFWNPAKELNSDDFNL